MSNDHRVLHQSNQLVMPDGSAVELTGGHRHCPVCHCKSPGRKRFNFESFEIEICPECGTMHLSPLPEPDALTLLYNQNYFKDPVEAHGYFDYAADEDLVRRTYRERLQKIARVARYSRQVDSVHEIGCALGFGLAEAKDIFKCKLSASDISQEGVRACQAKGWDCYQADVMGRCELPGGRKVDLVYMFDVIEHLYDFKEFLAWLPSIISPKGILALTTPDMGGMLNHLMGKRSLSIKIPQHIIYFTTNTLVRAFSSEFNYLRSFTDYQFVTIGNLVKRFRHVIGLRYKEGVPGLRVRLRVPTGMRLYVFQKKN